MFNVNSINSSRFNGVLSYSTKKTTSRKDRKGCKKEKIDSILKDKMVSACRPPIQVHDKKPVKHVYHIRANHGLKTNRKPEISEPVDPYSFTEQDAQQPKRYTKLHEDYLNGQSSSHSLGHVINKQLNTGSSFRATDLENSIVAKKLSESSSLKAPNKAVSKPTADNSQNRSNLVYNFPQNKCKVVPEDCKYGSQVNVPISKNILPDFGRSIGKVVLRPKRKLSNWQKDNGTKHEALQRIQDLLKQNTQLQSDLFPLEFSSSEDEEEIVCDDRNLVELCSLPPFPLLNREARLSQVKRETCKKLQQTLLKVNSSNSCPQPVVSSIINAARVCPSQTAFLLNPQYNPSSKKNRSNSCLIVKRICCLDSCASKALPGARYCLKHILYSVDQQLFSHCSWKLSDNTQCHNPVFHIKNTSPLCPTHAKQVQNKPPVVNTVQVKKPKKKSKSLMSRHRGKKRRKMFSSDTNSSTSASDVAENFTAPVMTALPSVSSMILRRGEEVFLTDASVPVNNTELDTNVGAHCEMVQLEAEVTEELANSRLLDDHEDLSTVLSQLPADAFNDLFSDKNGQYIPTREETEELERALAEVDKDVRCLERMTRSHIDIYDSVNLNSTAIPEDLNSQLYTGYPNGYASSTVALTNSNPQKL